MALKHDQKALPNRPIPAQHIETTDPIPRLLRVNQVAEMLTIGRSSVYAMLDSGELRSIKFGGARRIPLSSVQDLIARRLEDIPPYEPAPHTMSQRTRR